MNFFRKIWQNLSKKQRQWAWFIVLWCGGLGAIMLVSLIIRKAMGL